MKAQICNKAWNAKKQKRPENLRMDQKTTFQAMFYNFKEGVGRMRKLTYYNLTYEIINSSNKYLF